MQKNIDLKPLLFELEELSNCALCPRRCHANRISGKPGYCNAEAFFSISSVCIHRGEEPVISGTSGICNIFFSNCNLQCTYCQNYQISNNHRDHTPDHLSLEEVIYQITTILNTGISSVGFVSPSHMIPQMKVIIHALEMLGYHPTWVYNTNCYDTVETLHSLEGLIDVYLPDFKYMNPMMARVLSDASDYPEVASAALKEMYRQKGSALIVNDEGYAESGILIRHLVIPGYIQNSLDVIRFIAQEISPRMHIALMSQYYPAYKAKSDQTIGRTLEKMEYLEVVKEMEKLGLDRGYIQKISSYNHYKPDFNKIHPFEPD